jgi:acetyl-CoA synthetase
MVDSDAATPDEIVHEPDPAFVEATNVRRFMREHGIPDRETLLERSCGLPEETPDDAGIEWFWDVVVEHLGLEFFEPYDAVRDDTDGPQFSEWYPGGRLNLAHNALDRHADDPERRNRAALVWEGEPGEVRELTFHELRRRAAQVANALAARGVEAGDTVGIYMPMVPEVVAALYGCLELGAVAVPIFSGFGVDAVATRLAEPDCSVLLTADGFYRRGDVVALEPTAAAALERVPTVEHAVVYERLPEADRAGTALPDAVRERWREAVGGASDAFEPASLPSNHESMLLYSSGTTGAPKGIVHTHAGVLVQTAKEIHFGFDRKPGDRFFWLSDVGWMMGPWTLVGNHALGGTVVLYEGAPDHPAPDRLWAMVERHSITQFGVSPTAIRALRRHGDEAPARHDLSSLRLLGSTGEPWDEDAWRWFYEHVGGAEIPIVNISGGTEICGCFLMPMPDQPLKPCTLGGPGLGMAVDVVDADCESVAGTGERGYLVARDSCPSMTRSLWEGDERYLAEYWSTWPDVWDHGDWARVDDDGFWFLLGRADDALNVAGRKVGPAEVEAAVTAHPGVAEAAAVGVPDETTGTAVVVYAVTAGADESDALRADLRERVGRDLGKPFRPREVRFVDALPKTQSGKVMRRLVASVHAGTDLGDTSSVENPAALEEIRAAR